MFIKKLLLLFFLLFSINGYAKNKWYIKNITFYGLHRVSEKNISNYIKKYNGKIITLNNLSKVVYDLLKTGQFKNIKVIKFKNNLIFKIKEQSEINIFNFPHHIAISNRVLKRLLNYNNIKIGHQLNLNYLYSCKNVLKKYYTSIGHYNIDVILLFSIKFHNTAYFKILIKEKKFVSVQNINIFGNRVFSSKKIIFLFKSYNRPDFWSLILKKNYCIKKFNQDLKNLKNFYLKEGYIFFNFNKIKVILSPDKKRVSINIYITEGKKYSLSRIFIHGKVFSYLKKINNFIHKKIRKKFDFNQIIILKKMINNIFLFNGYPDFHMIMYFTINKNNNNLNFHFYIYPKQRYLLKKIYFLGNKFTTHVFLRSKIKHKNRTWLNLFLLMQGKKNLLETGFFKDIKINLYNFKNKPREINVIYNIEENKTGSINFGFGYGMNSGINFNANVIQNHLFNMGSKIYISVLKDINQTSGLFAFQYPFFNIFNNTVKSKLFYNYFKFNKINSMYYQNKRYGVDCTLGFLINKKNEFNIGINYIYNNIDNVKFQFSIWRYFQSLKSDFKKYNTNDVFIKFFWIFNTLSYKNFNLLGNNTIFSAKITTLGSDNNFSKIKLESKEYFKFHNNDSITLFIHTYFGFGYSDSFSTDLPFYENYYSGGIGSVRGFKYNSIGPKDIYYNKHPNFCMGKQNYKFCQSNDVTGGNAIIVTNLELIKKTLLNNKLNIITVSLFLDSAAVWNTNWINSLDSSVSNFLDYSNPNDIRISTGITLKWFSPLGPLNFSYAYPLKYNDLDKIESFQFSIGKTW